MSSVQKSRILSDTLSTLSSKTSLILLHLKNTKNKVQQIFSKVERSGNLVSSRPLLEDACDVGRSVHENPTFIFTK